jgi:hypothetical protein
LAGVNIGLYPETGVAAAVGIQVNTPGVIRFNRDGTRITKVAQAAEINGVTFQFSPGEQSDSAEQTGAGGGESVFRGLPTFFFPSS